MRLDGRQLCVPQSKGISIRWAAGSAFCAVLLGECDLSRRWSLWGCHMARAIRVGFWLVIAFGHGALAQPSASLGTISKPGDDVWVATGDKNLGRVDSFSGQGAECKYSVRPASSGQGDFYVVEWTGVSGKGSGGFAGWQVTDFKLDVSRQKVVELWLRSDQAGAIVKLGLKDSRTEADSQAKFATSSTLRLGREWQRFRVPLSDFKGIDLTSVSSVVVEAVSPARATIYLDSLSFRVPPPPPTFSITSPTNRGGANAYDTIQGVCTIPGVQYVVPFIVPDGDGIAYEQPRADVGADGSWSSNCRFGRLSSIDDGVWFTVYAEAKDGNGRLLKRSASIRVYRKPYR
jgi:hypothetical protein